MKKSSKPLVSVVIPVHNRHDLFEKCLKSVYLQNVKNLDIEVIVVDEASNPSIRTYIKNTSTLNRIKNLIVIRNSRALGPSLARTRGLNRARGSYVAFLDSDDLWHRNFLSITLPQLDVKKPQIASSLVRPLFIGKVFLVKRVYFSFINYVRNIVVILASRYNNEKLPYDLFYLLRLSSMVFTRESIRETKFVMSYRTAEDWKFFWDCIRQNNPEIKIIGKTSVDVSYHDRSETFRRSNYWHYYYKLVKELPLSMQKTIGIKFFRLYTDFSVWKNKIKL